METLQWGDAVMPDMLVKLYELPDSRDIMSQMESQGITIRRAIAPEKHVVLDWINEYFGEGWASEADVAICQHPSTCIIAIDESVRRIVGFACYEATNKNYFGPTGVDPAYRGRGIGKALLIAAMEGLRELGYAYSVIGGAGPTEFYAKSVGAIPIPDSSPGIYRGMLKREPEEE